MASLGLPAILADLTSKPQPARKKALEALQARLDTDVKRRHVSDDQWVHVLRAAMLAAKLELDAALKGTRGVPRPPKREFGELVERCVKWADSADSGGARLSGAALQLVRHVVETLTTGDGETLAGYGPPYLRVLEHVLGDFDYVSRLPPGDVCAVIVPRLRKLARSKELEKSQAGRSARALACGALRALAERGVDLRGSSEVVLAVVEFSGAWCREVADVARTVADVAVADVFAALAAALRRAPATAGPALCDSGAAPQLAAFVARHVASRQAPRHARDALMDYVATCLATCGAEDAALAPLVPKLWAELATAQSLQGAAGGAGAVAAPPRAQLRMLAALTCHGGHGAEGGADRCGPVARKRFDAAAAELDAAVRGKGKPALPWLQLCVALVEAASAAAAVCAPAAAVPPWCGDAAAVAAARGVPLAAVAAARAAWCERVRKLVVVASHALAGGADDDGGAVPPLRAVDERVWALRLLDALAMATRVATEALADAVEQLQEDARDRALESDAPPASRDAAEHGPEARAAAAAGLGDAWRIAWCALCAVTADVSSSRERHAQEVLAAASWALAAALAEGVVDAVAVADGESARLLWRCALFSRPRTELCTPTFLVVAGLARLGDVDALGGAAAHPRLALLLGDAAADDDGDGETEDSPDGGAVAARPAARRWTLVRWVVAWCTRECAPQTSQTPARAPSPQSLAAACAAAIALLRSDTDAPPTRRARGPEADAETRARSLVDFGREPCIVDLAPRDRRGAAWRGVFDGLDAAGAGPDAHARRGVVAAARQLGADDAPRGVARPAAPAADLDAERAARLLAELLDGASAAARAAPQSAAAAEALHVAAAVAVTVALGAFSRGGAVPGDARLVVARALAELAACWVRPLEAQDALGDAAARRLSAAVVHGVLARVAIEPALRDDAAVDRPRRLLATHLLARLDEYAAARGAAPQPQGRDDAAHTAGADDDDLMGSDDDDDDALMLKRRRVQTEAPVKQGATATTPAARATAVWLAGAAWAAAPSEACAARLCDVFATAVTDAQDRADASAVVAALATARPAAVDAVVADRCLAALEACWAAGGAARPDGRTYAQLGAARDAFAALAALAERARDLEGGAGAWLPRVRALLLVNETCDQPPAVAALAAALSACGGARAAQLDAATRAFRCWGPRGCADVKATAQQFINVLMTRLGDAHDGVRAAAADAAAALFESYTTASGQLKVWHTLEQRLPQGDGGNAAARPRDAADAGGGGDAFHRTTLVLVAAVLAVRGCNAADAALARLVLAPAHLRPLAAAAAARAARRLGFAGAAALVRAHAPRLVRGWLLDGARSAGASQDDADSAPRPVPRALRDFPWHFAAAWPDADAFFDAVAPALAPAVAAHQDAKRRFDVATELAGALGLGEDDAARRAFLAARAPAVVAHVLLLRARTQPGDDHAAARAHTFAQREVGGEDAFNRHTGLRLARVVRAIFAAVVAADATPAEARGALGDLAQSHKGAGDDAAEVRRLLARTNAAELILRLGLELRRAAPRRGGAYGAFALALDAAGVTSCGAATDAPEAYAANATAAVAALVAALRHGGADAPAATVESFELAVEAASDAAPRRAALAALAPILGVALGSIAAAAAPDAPDGSSDTPPAAAAPPADDVWGWTAEDAADARAPRRDGDAGWIALRGGGVDAALGRRAAALAARIDALARGLPRAVVAPGDGGSGPLELPARVAALARLRDGLRGGRGGGARGVAALCVAADARERGLASECVGELGVAHFAGARSRADGGRGDVARWDPFAADGAAAPAVVAGRDDVAARKLCLARVLVRCLVDESRCVAAAARDTVRRLATTADGAAVLRALAETDDGDAHARLAWPFIEQRAIDASRVDFEDNRCVRCRPSAPAKQDEVRAWSEEAWERPGATPEAWLRAVVPALLRECYARARAATGGADADAVAVLAVGDDVFLSWCGPLAALSGDFAAALLPLIVYDLVGAKAGDRGDVRRGARDVLSARFAAALGNRRVDGGVHRVLVAALDFVRGCELDLFLAGPAAPQKRGKRADDGADRGFVASPPRDGSLLPYGAPLAVPAAVVAAAASRAHAPCSALLYAELARDDCGGAAPEGLGAALAAAYSALGDADALRGGANDEATRLRSYEADGAWGRVAAALDAAAARDDVGSENVGSDVGPPAGGDAARRSARPRASVAVALRRLGYAHVVDAYVDAARGDGGDDGLGELRAEAAWRAARWGADGAAARGGGAVPGGFDSALHAALCCVARRDAAGARVHAEAARDAEVSRVAAAWSAETRGALELDLATRLHIVAEVRDAADAGGAAGGGCDVGELERRWARRLGAPSHRAGARPAEGWTTGGVMDYAVPACDFGAVVEPVLAAREAALRALLAGGDAAVAGAVRTPLKEHLYAVAAAATRAAHGAVAAQALARLRPLVVDDALRFELAEARLLWSRGERDDALRVARRVVDAAPGAATLPAAQRRALHSQALELAGAWAAATRSETATAVLDRYLREAVNGADDEARPRAALALGDYVSRLLADAIKRVRSAEWVQATRVAADRRRDLAYAARLLDAVEAGDAPSAKKRRKKSDGASTAASAGGTTSDDAAAVESRATAIRRAGSDAVTHLKRQTLILRRECELDDAQRATVEASVSGYLLEALRAFAGVLCTASPAALRHSSAAASKLCALWLANADNCAASAVVEDLAAAAPRDALKALEPLLHQLSSRLGGDRGDGAAAAAFAKALEALVLRLCDVAPARGVLQLVALANGDAVSGRGAEQFRANHDSSEGSARVAAAKRLLDELRGGRAPPAKRGAAPRAGANAALVGALVDLAAAYVDLAMADTTAIVREQRHSGASKLAFAVLCATKAETPFDQRCARAVGRDAATAPPVITRMSQGDSAPSLVRFEPQFALTDTGISRPKIVKCVGGDGKVYRQLVKGNDDVRQDAVMQQVFEAVNALLRAAARSGGGAATARLRTYAVVPLSPIAGVIEWVEESVPFGEFLTGRHAAAKKDRPTGAHPRYFPRDLTHAECRSRLQAARETSLQPDRLRREFVAICGKFGAAFRFFFYEHFVDAAAWLDRRGAYTRSVAAASMVGHVLGIGDRHAQNILVDTRTAEVVHIDFGIAFEQGKALAAPETVPFRLTRDVVDGFGLAATGGAFAQCCVATMATLRDHAPSLMTILDVLIHDPLYKWMLSPRDARHRQRAADDDSDGAAPAARDAGGLEDRTALPADNQAAERALLRVRQKLQGYGDDDSDVLGVHGQVNQLIAEAVDPGNLCRLFPGWAPWL